MNYKLLVIDDEKLIRDLLLDYFTAEDYLVITAQNSEEALEKISLQPDLIILDINMPGMDGIELCKIIRDHITCPIIFLTAKVNEQDKINGLQVGGDDYITKPFSLEELSARIKAHLRREARGQTTSHIRFSNGLLIDYAEKVISYKEKAIVFSKREFEIIELLSMNPKQVFEKEYIYELLWGLEASGDSNVIKEHIRKIRTKLLQESNTNYIETVWGLGYKWKS